MAKADLGAIPIIGAVMRQLQTFFVHRSNKAGNKSGNHAAGRHAVSDQIRARVRDARFPPILIFPQGTTTSGSVLTKFAAGAFLAGVPVQPVVVHYPFCCLDPAWVPGPSTGWLLLRMLCQFHNFLTVTYLPVYEPSAAEVKDPHLFADNVRRVMADRLGAAVTDHSYNDVFMMMKMGTYAIDRITRHQLFEGGGGGDGGDDGGGSAAGNAGSMGSVGGTGGTGGTRGVGRAEGAPQGNVAPGVTAAVDTGRRQCEPILADSMMHLSGTNVSQALGLLELFRKADVDSTARITQGHFCRVWTAHRDDCVGPDTPPLPPSSNAVLQRLFRIFDRHGGSSSGGGGGSGGGGLTLRGVCVGWSKLRDTDLTFEQQCKLVFVTYDLDDDGRVAASDIHDVAAFVRAHHSSATGSEGGTAGAVVGGGGVAHRRVLCSTTLLVDDIANAFARFGATGAAVASSGGSGVGEQGGAFETGEGTAGAAEEKGEAKGGNEGEGGSGGGGDGGGETMVHHPPGLLSLEGFQAVCREHPEYLDALLRNLRCLETFIRDTLVDSRRRR